MWWHTFHVPSVKCVRYCRHITWTILLCVTRARLVLKAWKFIAVLYTGNQGSSASIVTMVCDTWPRNRGSISSRDKRFLSFPLHVERLVVSSSLITGHRNGVVFPRGWSGRGVKLTTHLHLVPILRISGTHLPLYCAETDTGADTALLFPLALYWVS
jgi:hypothetical protein